MELCGFPRPETLGTGKHEKTIRDRDMDCAIWPGRNLATHRSPQGELQPSSCGFFFAVAERLQPQGELKHEIQ